MNFMHQPVMLNEILANLQIKPGGVYVDGTLGGGGHSAAIAQKLTENGLLVGIDKDGAALAAATQKLAAAKFTAVRNSHENITQILQSLKITSVDGFLLDLGVSSHQLDTPQRGFSFRYDAPLDMRMDDRADFTAYTLLNSYSEKQLTAIIKNYGEERFAKRITKAIINNRPIKTTLQLSNIIIQAVPKTPKQQLHPATRTFQAIRIAVNGELIGLSQTIKDMSAALATNGRICIITFHSLEDRIVKQTFKHLSDPCQCPKDIPYCVCGEKPTLAIITKKPIYPTQQEISTNPRASSAKLRVAEKL
ncbi:MAG: 16S rRNA (cytosine(1402)-N(4))-methyltransferase RsmH [Defluviitaleaceae bacterium]|nr:16S rRNA (cytosine(1402)-N(4))-methyltransferase RsmH [Defluviitaleaceae bacterium]